MASEGSDINVKLIKKTDKEIELEFQGVPLAVVNAIRRLALEEVPSMAVDYVIFYDNTSVLHDEILAHRIALIPLTSDEALRKYLPPEECASEEFRPKEGCYTSLYLEVRTGENEERVVYSGDLIPREDPDVKPVSDRIPIIVLGPNQRIALEAWARLGRGREHIKWSPANISVSTYVAKVNVDEGKCVNCGLCAEYCPTGALVMEGGRLKIYEDRCTLCRQCVRVCEYDAIKLGWYEDRYRLKVESSGALKPERIVFEAIKILNTRLKEMLQLVEEVRHG